MLDLWAGILAEKKNQKNNKTNKFLSKKMICFHKIDVNSFSVAFMK